MHVDELTNSGIISLQVITWVRVKISLAAAASLHYVENMLRNRESFCAMTPHGKVWNTERMGKANRTRFSGWHAIQ